VKVFGFFDPSDEFIDLYVIRHGGLYGGFLLIITRQKKTSQTRLKRVRLKTKSTQNLRSCFLPCECRLQIVNYVTQRATQLATFHRRAHSNTRERRLRQVVCFVFDLCVQAEEAENMFTLSLSSACPGRGANVAAPAKQQRVKASRSSGGQQRGGRRGNEGVGAVCVLHSASCRGTQQARFHIGGGGTSRVKPSSITAGGLWIACAISRVEPNDDDENKLNEPGARSLLSSERVGTFGLFFARAFAFAS
jgi:hypothetical protein